MTSIILSTTCVAGTRIEDAISDGEQLAAKLNCFIDINFKGTTISCFQGMDKSAARANHISLNETLETLKLK